VPLLCEVFCVMQGQAVLFGKHFVIQHPSSLIE
jgi:hypothetical protein